MKRYFTIASVVLAVVFLFSACGGGTALLKDAPSASTSPSVSKDPYRIALVMKTLTNPFFVDMEKGARKAESELGIKLIVKTGAQETSIEQQIQIVEELIAQKVNAIVIAPGSSVDLVKVLKKAQDAGIVIVNIDNRLDAAECQKQGLTGVPFISVKNDDAAYLSAKTVADLVSAPTKAAIIEGIRDADNAEQRRQGAVRAFSENSKLTVAASETANWKIDESYAVTKKIFAATPDIKVVFCANDMMALGVVQYLKENNLKNVLVAGFDNLDDMKTAIQENWAYVTVDQQADLQGYTGIAAAVKMLGGKTVDMNQYVSAKVVTAATLSK